MLVKRGARSAQSGGGVESTGGGAGAGLTAAVGGVRIASTCGAGSGHIAGTLASPRITFLFRADAETIWADDMDAIVWRAWSREAGSCDGEEGDISSWSGTEGRGRGGGEGWGGADVDAIVWRAWSRETGSCDGEEGEGWRRGGMGGKDAMGGTHTHTHTTAHGCMPTLISATGTRGRKPHARNVRL